MTAAPVCAQGFGPTETGQDAWLSRSAEASADPVAEVSSALRTRLARSESAAALKEFYKARDYRPFWAASEIRPESWTLLEALERWRDPRATELRSALEAADPARPESLARVEVLLSKALAEAPTEPPASAAAAKTGVVLDFMDPELEPRPERGRDVLEAAVSAPSLDAYLRSRAPGRNVLAAALAEGLERYRANWGALPEVRVPPGPELRVGVGGARVLALRKRLGLAGSGAYDATLAQAVAAFQRAHGLTPSGRADAATIEALNAGPWRYEQAIIASLERAKALPTFGDRYILVDAAAGELWFYDHGVMRKSMKVVVGKPDMATPMMAGMLRHAIFNPYWNVPEDLVRTSIAPKVLGQGLGYLADEGMEVLSDYTQDAVVLDPATVDWRAVRDGRVSVRVRQKPGPKNMMGQVKLAFPNPLGIFLHDTPLKELFGLEQRTASSGCVRLEDAMALAELLVGEERARELVAGGEVEKPVALTEAVPVFITYLTAAPRDDGFVFRPDIYGRDKAWATQTAARKGVPVAG